VLVFNPEELLPLLLFLSDENAGTDFPSPSKGSMSSYTLPFEVDELLFFVLLELLNLLISSKGSVKLPVDESIGDEVDSNTLKGSSAAVEVVLDALTVGSEDKPISGACLLLTICKNDYDTSNNDEINNIYESLVKDNMEKF
jgi:hypothetical protein